MNGAQQSNQVCPECAAPRTEQTAPTPWVVRHRRLVQLAVLLTAIAWIAWRNWLAWPVLPVPTALPGGYFHHEFPAHRFARADIERYASGEVSDGILMGDLHSNPIWRKVGLGVSFVPPFGSAAESRRYGWPMAIISYMHTADSYDDVYARTGASAHSTNFPNGWWGYSYVSRRINDHGERVSFAFSTEALAAASLVLIAAWGMGRVLRRAVFAVRVSERGGSRRRDRFVRALPIVCVCASAVGVLAASLVPRTVSDARIPIRTPAFADTGLTLSDVRHLASQATGEAALARAILDATEDTPTDPEACLAFGWESEIAWTTAYTSGGWPSGLLSYRAHEQQGSEPRGRPRIRVSTKPYWAVVVVRWDGPPGRVVHYNLSVLRGARLVLGLCAVWMGAGLFVGVVRLRIRRRTARRLQRGWCVRCGYDLRGLGRASGASTE